MSGFDKFLRALLFGIGVITSFTQTVLLALGEDENLFIIFLCGVATMTFIKYFWYSAKEMNE